jgi:hypothetical protein
MSRCRQSKSSNSASLTSYLNPGCQARDQYWQEHSQQSRTTTNKISIIVTMDRENQFSRPYKSCISPFCLLPAPKNFPSQAQEVITDPPTSEKDTSLNTKPSPFNRNEMFVVRYALNNVNPGVPPTPNNTPSTPPLYTNHDDASETSSLSSTSSTLSTDYFTWRSAYRNAQRARTSINYNTFATAMISGLPPAGYDWDDDLYEELDLETEQSRAEDRRALIVMVLAVVVGMVLIGIIVGVVLWWGLMNEVKGGHRTG